MFLANNESSKPAKWSAKYGSLVIAISCLLTTITSWGENWILTIVLGLGVLTCGTISIFDIKKNIND
ncbi:hypothetical protein LCL96_15885 [Rossellomorea aquimaris]|uniref:hypothetical protein n=1 Tax=Rossellomorea aquimaris TaxID=189382 RepID=UPI001CD7505B|nr:hypothetical protein [Rossellomorea aquimaris]MCA1060418.1 hypothetical protein [Rossellomorea aquimaris]